MISTDEEIPIIEEPKPSYCIELKEVWAQFDQIKWTSNDYSDGWVRIGDINIAYIKFWEEAVEWKYNDPVEKEKMSEEKLLINYNSENYYWGYKVRIYSLTTGEKNGWYHTIDFGGKAYLHKKDWKWKDNHEVDVTSLIKKIAMAMMFVEVWCS